MYLAPSQPTLIRPLAGGRDAISRIVDDVLAGNQPRKDGVAAGIGRRVKIEGAVITEIEEKLGAGTVRVIAARHGQGTALV